ncbi:hypothetical protein [Catenuloplanes atrovinosus]|uniref:Uncharacterized protein n=1 Tax=Catenuloplanes atrovinosus TaxID=137266 RepID=A0AAE3YMY2_9ACTN|nr:hypothetical protein [Catenuloplanes atrovinosus]MDR7276739.1 hypothetical protein [Catenuloplanes atrovinosus]
MNEIPIIPRAMDAICMDHVVPVGAGVYLRGPLVDADTDPLLDGAWRAPAFDGLTAVLLGTGMIEAAGAGTGPAVVRAREVLFQFLRGMPPEAVDRMVEFPLRDDGGDLAGPAARADLLGLPVIVPATAARRADASAAAHRVTWLDRDGRPVPRTDAVFARIAPARHWAPHPYHDVPPSILDHDRPYPPGRILLDGEHIHIGLPTALVDHRYGDVLRAHGRRLDARDLTGPAEPVDGLGDLLARLERTPPGTHALVAAGDHVLLAVHDGQGVALLDPGTGTAAVFTGPPTGLRLALLPGHDLDVRTRLLDLDAGRPRDAPDRPVRRPAGVRSVRDLPGGRTLDVVGGASAAPERFLDQLAAAAATLDHPVIVVEDERTFAPPGRGQRHRLESLLFQHALNGRVPVVVTRGGVDPALVRMLGRYGAPLLYRTTGTGDFTLDNPWVAHGLTGLPPATELDAGVLGTVTGRISRPELPRPHERLASYLSLPLTDAAAVRAELAAHGTALKELRGQIAALDTDGLFTAHDTFLRLAETAPALAETALDFLAAGDARHDRLPTVVPTLLAGDASGAALADFAALTGGVLDDGASGAILEAVRRHLAGDDPAAIRAMIHQHAPYLPQSERVHWVRRLAELGRGLTEHRAGIDQIAEHVLTCP